jgi:hypothetical protein
MNRIDRRRLAFAFCVLSAGCDAMVGVSPRGHDPFDLNREFLQTDSAVYHVVATDRGHEFQVALSYTNATRDRVYVGTCHRPDPPVLQKLEEGVWVTAWAPPVLSCLGPPLVIESSQVHEFDLHVVGYTRPSTYPRFLISPISGTYRFVWRVLGTWTPDGPGGLGQELPLEQRISNTFQIKE